MARRREQDAVGAAPAPHTGVTGRPAGPMPFAVGVCAGCTAAQPHRCATRRSAGYSRNASHGTRRGGTGRNAARAWWEKAAKLGDPTAMTNLGFLAQEAGDLDAARAPERASTERTSFSPERTAKLTSSRRGPGLERR